MDPQTASEVIRAAAFGDPTAQRRLAAESYESIEGADDLRALILYVEAITIARFMVMHGERQDARVLLYLLASFGGFLETQGFADCGLAFSGAAVALAESMSEEGDEEVGDMLAASANELPAEVFLQAQFLRDQCGHARVEG